MTSINVHVKSEIRSENTRPWLNTLTSDFSNLRWGGFASADAVQPVLMPLYGQGTSTTAQTLACRSTSLYSGQPRWEHERMSVARTDLKSILTNLWLYPGNGQKWTHNHGHEPIRVSHIVVSLMRVHCSLGTDTYQHMRSDHSPWGVSVYLQFRKFQFTGFSSPSLQYSWGFLERTRWWVINCHVTN